MNDLNYPTRLFGKLQRLCCLNRAELSIFHETKRLTQEIFGRALHPGAGHGLQILFGLGIRGRRFSFLSAFAGGKASSQFTPLAHALHKTIFRGTRPHRRGSTRHASTPGSPSDGLDARPDLQPDRTHRPRRRTMRRRPSHRRYAGGLGRRATRSRALSQVPKQRPGETQTA